MYIEVEGKTYFISIRDSEKSVSIIGQQEDIVHLAVSAQLSQVELITYLKSAHFRSLVKVNKLPQMDTTNTINALGADFTLIIQKGLLTPYIAGKSLYADVNPKSKMGLNKLLEQILRQELNRQIGFWEEKLNVLISDIYIRKLKTNYHTICTNSSRLTFDKNLVHKTKEFIAYLCAVAVFDYLELEESIREKLADQYVKDWKHHQKVFLYELTK